MYVLSFLYSVLISLNFPDVLFIGRVILMIQLIRESSPELCKIYSITFTIWMKIWSFTLRFVLFIRTYTVLLSLFFLLCINSTLVVERPETT